MIRRALLVLIGLTLALSTDSPAWAQTTAFRSDRIVVETRGRGPDVILIPGLASTGLVWGRLADRLDDDHTVHLISVRGFGDLPAGANASGPLVGPVSAEVLRYIRTKGLRSPAVIGHSMGGLVALRAAADGGRTVGRVMLVDSSPFFPALVDGAASARSVEPIARVAYQAVLFLGDEALNQTDWGSGAGQAVMTGMGWQGGDRRVLAQGLYEVMTLDMRGRLDDVTAPVTVAYGWSREDGSPRRDLERRLRPAFAGLRAPLRLEPIEGAEHMVMIDRPRQFEAAVLRFLR
jgi:pimeloyl-[acyl-carrier protein] methyl ester esterase